jgi:catechol 2,3-dioxygenase-like lactoylglutathione lyase family enzyme
MQIHRRLLKTAVHGSAALLLAFLSVHRLDSAQIQLIAPADAPISYIHHHFYVSDLEVQKKFWVDALGGKYAGKLMTTPVDVIKFRNVQVLLSPTAPKGGTKGTTVNHVGFGVPNLRATVDKLKGLGYRIVTREELPPTDEVKDGISYRADQKTSIAFVMLPDDIKIEFLEDTSMQGDLLAHHAHFNTPDVAAMRAWYVTVFGARPGKRGSFEAADVPGLNLTFSPSAGPVAPTGGRAFDHLGFEIKNLEQFCKDLEAKGVKLDRGYARPPGWSLAVAFLTDPWGTKIELTEGLGSM